MESLQKSTLKKVKYFKLVHCQRNTSKMEKASQDCELKVVEVKRLVGECPTNSEKLNLQLVSVIITSESSL